MVNQYVDRDLEFVVFPLHHLLSYKYLVDDLELLDGQLPCHCCWHVSDLLDIKIYVSF